MTYASYLIAAYAVFVLVLGWDYLATQLQIRRELRNARLRATRQATRKADATSELVR
jgi:heme exporter protein D